jgi:uncharacterized repeat protein (TIGR01451 family)
MKSAQFFTFFILTTFNLHAQFYPLLSAQKIQSQRNPSLSVASFTEFGEAILDSSGNIYVLGSFSDTLYPNPVSNAIKLIAKHSEDLYLAKYDATGAFLWAKNFGSGYGLDITLDRAQNIYVTGYSNAVTNVDFDPGTGTALYTSASAFTFIAKYDTNGTYLNSKIFSGNGVKGFGIAVDSMFNIYLVGSVTGQVDFDPGPGTLFLSKSPADNRNGFFSKYDSSMNVQWAKVDFNSRDCNDVAVHQSTNRVVIASAGESIALRMTNMNGTATDSLASSAYGQSVRVDRDGNIYCSGYFSSSNINFNWSGNNTLSTPSSTQEEGFLVKYNINKVFQWAKQYTSMFLASSYDASRYTVNIDENGNPWISFYESDGVSPQRGFFKVNSITGLKTGNDAVFNTNTAGSFNRCTILPQRDNLSLAFVANVGFSNLSLHSVDVNPDTSAIGVSNLTDDGIWTMIGFYSNCNSSPVTPGTITGVASLCDTTQKTYSVAQLSGVNSYTWTLPAGWIGNSNTNSIIVTPSANGGVLSVIANNSCGSSGPSALNISYTGNPSLSINASSTSVCGGTSVMLSGIGATTYQWSGGIGNGVAFTPATTTTYTVTGTSGICTATASQTITVNQNPVAGISPITSTICSGLSQTLTANGGGSYSWSNSGGTNDTASFSPSNTTTYTVTVQNAANCTATAGATVTVNQNPIAAITPSAVSICNGQSQTLAASGGGTYSWSNSGGTNAAAVFSPGNTTTYTVTVQNAANCTATADATVTVNPNPAAAITPSAVSICNGQSQTLTASGGGTYSWSNSGGANAAATFSPGNTITYTVTVQNANNCTATASATVTVNPVPIASVNGPTTICSGLSATLIAGGGGTYIWSNSLGSNDSITVSPISATTYTVTVTGVGNCTATASQTVSVQSIPTVSISGPNAVCSGGSITLTAGGGNTYTWSNSPGSSSGITVSPISTTTYTVTASLGANCTASASQTVSVLQPSSSSFSETICNEDSYLFDNQTLTQSGVYTKAEVNSVGCDSIVTLNLTVLTTLNTILNESICAGSSYDFDGQQLSQAGQYSATFTSDLGCDSVVTLNLSVTAAPQITQQPTANSTTVCSGETVTFDITATGNNLNYQWKEGTSNEGPNANTYTTAALTAGTKSYTVVVSNTCGSETSNAVNITVSSLPQPTITQSGFDLSTQPFNSYQWQLNGSNISGAQSQSYTAVANGNYTVEVTDLNSCSAVSSLLNVTGVSIMDLTDTELQVYPNPAVEELIIYCDEAIESAVVYNVFGEQVQFAREDIQKMNVKFLSQGIYTIQIHTTNGKAGTRRFMKQ